MATFKEIVKYAENNPLSAIPSFLGMVQPEGTPSHWPSYTGRRIFLAATEAVEAGKGDEEYSSSPKRRVVQKNVTAASKDVFEGLSDVYRALVPALYIKTGAKSASELKEFIITRAQKAGIENGIVYDARLPGVIGDTLDFFELSHDVLLSWAGLQDIQDILRDRIVEAVLECSDRGRLLDVCKTLGVEI